MLLIHGSARFGDVVGREQHFDHQLTEAFLVGDLHDRNVDSVIPSSLHEKSCV
jgi:hypothetical protein